MPSGYARGRLATCAVRVAHTPPVPAPVLQIEYYVNVFLTQRERNAFYHKQAARIQAGYRGRRARAEHKARAQQSATQRAAAIAEADALTREREVAASGVQFVAGTASAPTAAAQAAPAPQPLPDNMESMSVAELNEELTRGAQLAARTSTELRQSDDLVQQTARSTRGYLVKKSPNARLQFMCALPASQ